MGTALKAASCSGAGSQLFYLYNFQIAYRPGVTPSESVSWVARNFLDGLPAGGCAKVLKVGQVCELEDIPLLGIFDTFPIKVVGIAGDHFTFEALEEHFEPTGSHMRFSIVNGTYRNATGAGKHLWLRVTSWGNIEGIQSEPWKSLLLVDAIRHDMWAKFAQNIALRMPYNL